MGKGNGGGGSRGEKFAKWSHVRKARGLSIKGTKKISKEANEVFDRTYNAAKVYVGAHGDNDGKLALDLLTRGKQISLQGFKSVQARLDQEYKNVRHDFVHNLIDKEKFETNNRALDTIQRGINNQYRAYNKLKAKANRRAKAKAKRSSAGKKND